MSTDGYLQLFANAPGLFLKNGKILTIYLKRQPVRVYRSFLFLNTVTLPLSLEIIFRTNPQSQARYFRHYQFLVIDGFHRRFQKNIRKLYSPHPIGMTPATIIPRFGVMHDYRHTYFKVIRFQISIMLLEFVAFEVFQGLLDS
jgi:hypothetical protein